MKTAEVFFFSFGVYFH